MLLGVKDRLDDEVIQELLEYAVYSEGDAFEKTIEAYKSNDKLELFAYILDEEIIGIIGFIVHEQIMEIKHLAVGLEHRGLGYGRGMLLELISLRGPDQLVAETDDEAVDFYRSVGFSISSLGEKYPGVERFQCVFDVNEETQV